jgi:asparagine synthase (glutamine-hydrolysing)
VCGICGVFGTGDRDTVERMLERLIHRGPDDGHLLTGDRFTIGARRLSIVDLEGGRQPLTNETGSICAAQNGELYNFPELKADLSARGHRFRSRCDTELLPHLYEELGPDFASRIHGMFAVAVWDDDSRTGVLVRDRMGKKPLYYLESGGSVYFASEIKALLEVPGFTRRLDFEALHHFLSYKHVPAPLSIFEGIRIVPPGHLAVFKPGQPLCLRRYWAPDFTPDPAYRDASEEELTDHLLELLRGAVQRRLMSDVPVGFFLSGGLDSSLSAAIAAEVAPERVRTFTLTYDEGSTTPGKEQDRRWARWVADKYGTESHEEVVQFANLPETLPSILSSFDEPFAGVFSTYFLSRLISQHVKVAVSGDGADELFGSYLSHRLARPLANLPEYRRTGDRALIEPFTADYLEQVWAPEDWQWRSRLLVYDEQTKQSLYSRDVAAAMQAFSTAEHMRGTFSGLTATDPLNRVLEAEFTTQLPDQVLTFVDRLSMAHSLEVRTAYLDTQVVEFVASLPGHWKIRNGETKYLLKRVAARFFPHEMVHRPKEGFLMPVTEWMLNDLQPYVRETLSAPRLARHGIFDAAQVTALVERLYSPDATYRDVNRVLALVVFQVWHELYLS